MHSFKRIEHKRKVIELTHPHKTRLQFSQCVLTEKYGLVFINIEVSDFPRATTSKLSVHTPEWLTTPGHDLQTQQVDVTFTYYAHYSVIPQSELRS